MVIKKNQATLILVFFSNKFFVAIQGKTFLVLYLKLISLISQQIPHRLKKVQTKDAQVVSNLDNFEENISRTIPFLTKLSFTTETRELSSKSKYTSYLTGCQTNEDLGF